MLDPKTFADTNQDGKFNLVENARGVIAESVLQKVLEGKIKFDDQISLEEWRVAEHECRQRMSSPLSGKAPFLDLDVLREALKTVHEINQPPGAVIRFEKPQKSR